MTAQKPAPGALFIAVRGFASDGHKYIDQAIEKGAVAVVCEEIPGQARDEEKQARDEETQARDEGGSTSSPTVMADSDRPSVTFVKVANSRHAVAMAADAFYGHPSRKLTLVGITGTNGKTTTVTLLCILADLGVSSHQRSRNSRCSRHNRRGAA